uniref:Uncharacterized protein n=1 Tax=Blattella germanica TaxID=6973 RepID=C4PLH1_BLAGE|nr:hypothetical protein [Blattella germanica]
MVYFLWRTSFTNPPATGSDSSGARGPPTGPPLRIG